jgi:hypothetical protein
MQHSRCGRACSNAARPSGCEQGPRRLLLACGRRDPVALQRSRCSKGVSSAAMRGVQAQVQAVCLGTAAAAAADMLS